MDITSSGPEAVKSCLHSTARKLTYEQTLGNCITLVQQNMKQLTTASGPNQVHIQI